MSNQLSILGFGQCGSKIAVEVSASFSPVDMLSGLPSFSIRVLYEKFGKRVPADPGQHPAFYIADLNASNDVYVHYSKAQAIGRVLGQTEKTIPDKEVISRVNKNVPGVTLEPADANLIETVRRQRAALRMVQALYFAAGNEPLLTVGGAGGIQYLSEAIADQDTNLLASIDKRQNGALIGIFALGGGTGSGSLYALLRNYKRITPRYTVGIGILPYDFNIPQIQNAGRYFVKFLAAEIDDRFNTLFLFSNEVARVVLGSSDLDGGDNPLQIINAYVSSFIHDFSLINDQLTETLFGKLFDPMDGKRYLSGLANAGYASDSYGSDSRFSAMDLFVRAMSSMSHTGGRINGIAVRITRDMRHRAECDSLFAKLVESVRHEDSREVEQYATRLRALTPFYRTVKFVHIFYLICNRDFSLETFGFQDTIVKTFGAVVGGQVSVDVNCYLVSASSAANENNSVLVLIGGAFSFEVYDSALQFVENSFIESGKEAEFGEEFNKLLIWVRERQYSVSTETEVGKRVAALLDRCGCGDIERADELGSVEIGHRRDLKRVLDNGKLENLLIDRNAVAKALTQIACQFTLVTSRPKPTTDPFEVSD